MKNTPYLACSLLFLWTLTSSGAFAQYNCTIYKDSSYARACRVYNAVDSFYQGSPQCQYYLDSAIAICPGFAPAWHEKSVPYLKRGDFITWKRLLDKAVELDELQFLQYRGWCRFKFLRDYEGALVDLKRYDTLTGFRHNYSNDGNYELHIVMALCERELGHLQEAWRYFAMGIDSVRAQGGEAALGLYDYLHLGVTKMKAGDYPGAIAALRQENNKYDKFADTWYYLGCIYLATGNGGLARQYLEQAKALISDHSGKYHLYDIYCQMPDVVYPSEIDSALARLP